MANDYGISAYVFAPDSSDRTCRVVARVRTRLGTTGSRGVSCTGNEERDRKATNANTTARFLAGSLIGRTE